MAEYSPILEQLITELKKLPGIGNKSAQRMAFHLLKSRSEDSEALARAILEVQRQVTHCSRCFHITEQDPCKYCTDPARDASMICVVEEPSNVLAIDRTGNYRGLYHVLLGRLSPLQGIGPEDLKIQELLERLKEGSPQEVILATNPTVEGEATAVYISRLIKPLGVRVSRLAMGLPVGSDLEYTDQVTIQKAMEGRREI